MCKAIASRIGPWRGVTGKSGTQSSVGSLGSRSVPTSEAFGSLGLARFKCMGASTKSHGVARTRRRLDPFRLQRERPQQRRFANASQAIRIQKNAKSRSSVRSQASARVWARTSSTLDSTSRRDAHDEVKNAAAFIYGCRCRATTMRRQVRTDQMRTCCVATYIFEYIHVGAIIT